MTDRSGPVSLAALISLLVLPFSAFSALGCDFPDSVRVPDGRTATERHMITADTAIKKYITEVERYAQCVELEAWSTRQSAATQSIAAAKKREEQLARRLNKAAAAIEDVAERFNKAIAEYTSRNR